MIKQKKAFQNVTLSSFFLIIKKIAKSHGVYSPGMLAFPLAKLRESEMKSEVKTIQGLLNAHKGAPSVN